MTLDVACGTREKMAKRRLTLRLVCRVIAVVALVALWPLAPARAQSEGDDAGADDVEAPELAGPTGGELAAARQLFTDALELEAALQWEDALAKFEKVGKVKMTPQVRYHIALCHENLGRLVEAVNGYELAAQEARAAGPKARSVAKNAPPRAEALREQVAYVRIRIIGILRTSTIVIDDRTISLALIDTAIPVDPGSHILRVMRGDEVVHEQAVESVSAETQEIVLEIDDPEPSEPPPPPPPASPTPAPTRTVLVDTTSRIPAYVVGGAGIVALAGSAVFFGLSQHKIAQVAINCEGEAKHTGCNRDDIPNRDIGEKYHLVSQVLLGVGAGAFATGVVLFFVLDTEEVVDAPPVSSLTVAPSVGGVVITGQF